MTPERRAQSIRLETNEVTKRSRRRRRARIVLVDEIGRERVPGGAWRAAPRPPSRSRRRGSTAPRAAGTRRACTSERSPDARRSLECSPAHRVENSSALTLTWIQVRVLYSKLLYIQYVREYSIRKFSTIKNFKYISSETESTVHYCTEPLFCM